MKRGRSSVYQLLAETLTFECIQEIKEKGRLNLRFLPLSVRNVLNSLACHGKSFYGSISRTVELNFYLWMLIPQAPSSSETIYPWISVYSWWEPWVNVKRRFSALTDGPLWRHCSGWTIWRNCTNPRSKAGLTTSGWENRGLVRRESFIHQVHADPLNVGSGQKNKMTDSFEAASTGVGWTRQIASSQMTLMLTHRWRIPLLDCDFLLFHWFLSFNCRAHFPLVLLSCLQITRSTKLKS